MLHLELLWALPVILAAGGIYLLFPLAWTGKRM